MKRFLLKLLLFLAIMTIVDLCAGKIFLLRDYQKTGTRGRINHVINESEADVYVMGSSRAVHTYNSQILEDTLRLTVYNIGVDANGMLLASGIADLAFQRHKPRLIIFELTPAYDFTDRKNVDNLKFLQYLKPYYDTPEIREMVAAIDPLESLKLHSSLYRLNSSVIDLATGAFSAEDMPYKGYMPQYTTMKYDPPKPREEELRIDPVKQQILDSFLEKLKAQHIDIIFTISPVYSYPTEDYTLMKNYIESKGYIVLDHLRDSGFAGHKRYFSDSVHLNTEGADSLSSVVASQIKRLGY